MFVLDNSGSIGYNRYQLIREFTGNVTKLLDIGTQDSLVGVILYSMATRIHFNLLEHTSSATLLPALNPGLPYLTGHTNTSEGLRLLLSSAKDGTWGLEMDAVTLLF